jgi:hypothetical protein
MNNVLIEHRQHGSLVETRELHNVWTYFGKEYLSRVVSLQVLDDVGGDIPQSDFRIRYFGLGIGGLQASATAFGPVFLSAYPPGFDPNATNGHVYDKTNPTGPIISTLERPVRKSGGVTSYPGALSDIWLFDDLATSRQDINSVTFQIVVDCTSGDLIYSPFTYMPVSEAGLFHSGGHINMAYNAVVAYIDFATILLSSASVVTFSWTVRFAS